MKKLTACVLIILFGFTTITASAITGSDCKQKCAKVKDKKMCISKCDTTD